MFVRAGACVGFVLGLCRFCGGEEARRRGKGRGKGKGKRKEDRDTTISKSKMSFSTFAPLPQVGCHLGGRGNAISLEVCSLV